MTVAFATGTHPVWAALAMAAVATYLLWPRDRETEAAPVPAPTT